MHISNLHKSYSPTLKVLDGLDLCMSDCDRVVVIGPSGGGVITSYSIHYTKLYELRHLYPAADIPVVQISLPRQYGTLECWDLGRALAPLRQRNILLIGAGSITHNLYEMAHAAPKPYVSEFTDWVEQQIDGGELEALLDYRNHSASYNFV